MLERMKYAVAIGALVLGTGGNAFGGSETADPAGHDAAAPFVKSDAKPQQVDETALRYYASLKQTSRVEAETRRLQRLNPGWSPPDDLWTSRPGSADEGPLWELFATDRLDDLRKAIDERKAAEPNWAPSTDLAQKLLRKETRSKIVAGKNAGRWEEVAAAADQAKLEGDTSDVELLWDISDGYAHTKRAADALRILTSILNARSSAKERVATIHRAIASLPMAETERLIVAAAINLSDGEEADALAIDVARARVSAFLNDEQANEVSPAELTRFKDYARTATDPNQPGLVAWFALKRGDLLDALEWFKCAIALGGDATIAHGLAHTLRRLGQLREAEEIAYAWREPSPANAILFIDILADQLTAPVPASFDAKRIARYAQVTLQTSSGEGAQALAWFAYNSCQFDVAMEWFQRSVAWFPKETAVFGYALTLRRLKQHHEFIEIVNRYDGLFPKVLTLLFPDSAKQTASPCDGNPTSKVVRTSAKADEFLNLKPMQAPMRGGAMPNAVAARRSSPATLVPKPLNVGLNVNDETPLVRRSDFPIAVLPENPLRFAASGRGAVQGAATGEWRARETFASATMARRVPGVSAMPYEQFGMTLLRGWNGADKPSYSGAVETRAPLGTPWYNESAALRTSVASGAIIPVDQAKSSTLDNTSSATEAAARRFRP